MGASDLPMDEKGHMVRAVFLLETNRPAKVLKMVRQQIEGYKRKDIDYGNLQVSLLRKACLAVSTLCPSNCVLNEVLPCMYCSPYHDATGGTQLCMHEATGDTQLCMHFTVQSA